MQTYNHTCHLLGFRGAGDLTMVLDFGSFALDSDADAAADLPAEEAALYMGFKLSARNISSFLVDGDFSWALLKSLGSPGAKRNGAQKQGHVMHKSTVLSVPQLTFHSILHVITRLGRVQRQAC